MKFSQICDSFDKMDNTTKRLELTDILVDLLKNTPVEIISKVVYLIQGKLRPNFEGVELGIAEKLAMKAISKSAGITIEKIIENYNLGGDLGVTAANLLKQKTQTTFATETITLERVYDTLLKIAKLEGKGSQDMNCLLYTSPSPRD